MKASFESPRNSKSTLLSLTARNDDDMAKVNKVVKYLVGVHGYEEVASDDEHHIILGIYAHTIEDMKHDYREAKKAVL